MLLAVDVGNTHVVLGLYRGATLEASFRLESDRKRTVDEFGLQVLSLLQHHGTRPAEVAEVAISCVVPSLTRVFSKIAQKYFSVTPLVVGPEVITGVEITVDDPRALGADRLVNAVAAKQRFGAPVVVVDFGTATTFDVVSPEGAYEGGVIAPGVLISAEALFEKAALLPNIEFARPPELVGTNTRDSMLSGVFYGYASLVDGILERLKQRLGEQAPVVATGGLARSFAEESKYIEHVLPELTLEGLEIIARLNRAVP